MRNLIRGVAIFVLPFLLLTFNTLDRGDAATTRISLATWGHKEYWEALGNRFSQENPDIALEVQIKAGTRNHLDAMIVAAAGGAAPDLIQSNPQYSPAFQAAIWLPLDDFVRRDKFDFSKHIKAAWGYCYGRDGRLYAWPAGVDNPFPNHMFAYNASLFEEKGIDQTGVATWRWDSFLTLGRKLTVDADGDGKPEQFFVQQPNSYWYWNWVWSNGGDILSQDGKEFLLTRPEAVEALQFMADLKNVHNIVGTGNQYANFRNVKIAVANVPLGGMLNEHRLTPFPFDWRIARYPAGKGEEAVGRAGDLPLGIYRQSPNAEAAWKFLQWTSREDVQRWATFELKLMGAPYHQRVVLSRQYAQPEGSPHDLMPLIMQPYRFLPVFEGWTELDDLIAGAIDKGRAGSVSMSAALSGIEEAAKQILSRY